MPSNILNPLVQTLSPSNLPLAFHVACSVCQQLLGGLLPCPYKKSLDQLGGQKEKLRKVELCSSIETLGIHTLVKLEPCYYFFSELFLVLVCQLAPRY